MKEHVEFGGERQIPQENEERPELKLPGFAIVRSDLDAFKNEVTMPFPTDEITIIDQVGARPWCIVKPSVSAELSPQGILQEVPNEYMFHQITLSFPSIDDTQLLPLTHLIKANSELEKILPYDNYSLFPSKEGIILVMNRGHLHKRLAIKVVAIIEDIAASLPKT